MNYTIMCPGCGSQLKLFDSQVKQKRGFIRCTRCGQKIKYDLTKPDPVSTGFWADTEVPFKVGAQKRFLSIAKARQARMEKGEAALAIAAAPAPLSTPSISRVPQSFDRSQNHFQKFDMKTGQIISEKASPVQPASKTQAAAPKVPAMTAAPKPAAPTASPKPLTPAMRKLAELKKSLETYTARPAADHGQKAPRVPSMIKAPGPKSSANIPIAGRKAARTAGRARSSLTAVRPLHTQERTVRIQSSAGILNRLRALLSRFFQSK